MGRITIFTLASCVHCRRAKATLVSRGFQFSEVSLSDYPSRREDMISLTNRVSVPQIFVNDTHLGGNDDLHERIASDPNQFDCSTRAALDMDDPIDKRLEVPDPKDSPSTSHKIDFNELFSETLAADALPPVLGRYDRLTATCKLRENLSGSNAIKDRSVGVHVHARCFYGSDLFKATAKLFAESDSNNSGEPLDDEIIRTECVRLLESGVVKNVPKGAGDTARCTCIQSGATEPDSKQDSFSLTGLYRLQPDVNPGCVNAFRDGAMTATHTNSFIDPSAMLQKAQAAKSQLEGEHTTNQGSVNRTNLANDHDFHIFLSWFSLMSQHVSLEDIRKKSEHHLAAFLINAYNLTVSISSTTIGVSRSMFTRSVYFKEVGLRFSDGFYSLDDVEHGLLRGNVGKILKLNDARAKNVVDWRKINKKTKLDCRVHFALNCGAKSCPPVSTYTGESLDQELAIAAHAFCESDSNVSVTLKANTNKSTQRKRSVTLSRIFHWYRADFGSSDSEVLEKIELWCRFGSLKRQLIRSVIYNKNLLNALQYAPYDWSSDATADSKSFNVRSVRRSWGRVTGL